MVEKALAMSASQIVHGLQARFGRPRAAIVLGSGMNVFESLFDETSISFQDLFGSSPSVAGHKGVLTVGKILPTDSVPIAIFRGRFHLYEGHDWSQVTLPVRVVGEWGIPILLLTNAAGAINQSFSEGDLMIVEAYQDYVAPQFRNTGLLPALCSPAVPVRNDLTGCLTEMGGKLVSQTGSSAAIRTGVFAGWLGPCYETRAEIEMLRRLGADTVGMSTVPELRAIATAPHTQAAALNIITNVWHSTKTIDSHKEVLSVAGQASALVEKLFRNLLTELGASNPVPRGCQSVLNLIR
jgi:purine-nucleoside phosphorylase